MKKFKKNLSEVLNTFENIMLHFPQYFQKNDTSKASKGVIMEKRINTFFNVQIDSSFWFNTLNLG